MKAELQTRKKRQNLYGQAMGDKGASTREKILKATSMLMEKRGIRDLKVTEIGASAGVSSSTFYLYFEGVPQACLAVTKRINQSSPEILEILNRDWDASNIEENAKTFVKAYLAFWDSHSAILRLRNSLPKTYLFVKLSTRNTLMGWLLGESLSGFVLVAVGYCGWRRSGVGGGASRAERTKL